jgi:hypothetical protein
LSGFKRLVSDFAMALQLLSGYKLFDTFSTQRVAELGVAELRRANALLLLLDAAADFQREANGPFQTFVAALSPGLGRSASEGRTDRLVDAVDVAAG